MRVEQLIGNYANPGNRQRDKRGRTNACFAGRGMHAGTVLDIVCLSADEFEQDMDWFGAYVRQLPDEVVIEKIRQIFRAPFLPDDGLVEKLMFEVF